MAHKNTLLNYLVKNMDRHLILYRIDPDGPLKDFWVGNQYFIFKSSYKDLYEKGIISKSGEPLYGPPDKEGKKMQHKFTPNIGSIQNSLEWPGTKLLSAKDTCILRADNPGAHETVVRLFNNGEHVICINDMYAREVYKHAGKEGVLWYTHPSGCFKTNPTILFFKRQYEAEVSGLIICMRIADMVQEITSRLVTKIQDPPIEETPLKKALPIKKLPAKRLLLTPKRMKSILRNDLPF